jgi:hypothetical protein
MFKYAKSAAKGSGYDIARQTLNRGCGCSEPDAGLFPEANMMMPDEDNGVELAQAIIPFQRLSQGTLYPPEEALQNGTIFSALYKPYTPKKGSCK